MDTPTPPHKLALVLPKTCFKQDGSRRWFRTMLRFLNVVEPGPEVVLSWTRVGMALAILTMTFSIIFLTVFSPGNLAAMIGAVVGAAPFVVNYIHQRRCDMKTGGNPNSTGEIAQGDSQ